MYTILSRMMFAGVLTGAVIGCGGKSTGDSKEADSLAAVAAGMIADTSAIEEKSLAFICGDGDPVIIRTEKDIAWLTTKNGTQALPKTGDASTSQYSDGKSTVLLGVSETQITLNGSSYASCVEQAEGDVPWLEAKLRGVHFRSAGENPSWTLDVVEGQTITFRGATPEATVTVPAPIPMSTNATSTGAATSIYKTDRIVIEAKETRCNLGGQSVPWSVTATVDGKKYSGCGKALR